MLFGKANYYHIQGQRVLKKFSLQNFANSPVPRLNVIKNWFLSEPKIFNSPSVY